MSNENNPKTFVAWQRSSSFSLALGIARTMFQTPMRTAASRAVWRGALLEKAVQQTADWLRDFCHLIKDGDKVKMSKAVEDTWDCLDAHKVAKKRQYIWQKQDLENVVEPI